MKMTEHFKTPLMCAIGFDDNADEFYTLMDSDNEIVLGAFSRSEHGIESLVLAVNCHDDMLEALENIASILESIHEDNEVLNAYKVHYDLEDIKAARNTIAKAKGESQ